MYVYKEDDTMNPILAMILVMKIILNDGVNTFSAMIGTLWSIKSGHMMN